MPLLLWTQRISRQVRGQGRTEHRYEILTNYDLMDTIPELVEQVR